MVREGHDSPENDTVTISTSPHGAAIPDGHDEFTVRQDQLIR
ncbi:hypothetical protein [Streptodolium elevatio]|uniref:Uncharacterized protein n=1 Tax=Streptodolium elevatio TaxID=3157996 RepID=A0ABV3DLS0_9ACTN